MRRKGEFGDGMGIFESRGVSYFVYANEAVHLWRFVYFADRASSGGDAIDQAVTEGRALGNEPKGDYMAIPAPAITTRRVSAPAFGPRPS